jgi:hypothetical protein
MPYSITLTTGTLGSLTGIWRPCAVATVFLTESQGPLPNFSLLGRLVGNGAPWKLEHGLSSSTYWWMIAQLQRHQWFPRSELNWQAARRIWIRTWMVAASPFCTGIRFRQATRTRGGESVARTKDRRKFLIWHRLKIWFLIWHRATFSSLFDLF